MRRATIDLKGEKIHYNINVDISGLKLTEVFHKLRDIIDPHNKKMSICSIYFYEDE